MASAFGVWNLIAEIGAILSPVVSGALRDATGGWVSLVIVGWYLNRTRRGLCFLNRGTGCKFS